MRSTSTAEPCAVHIAEGAGEFSSGDKARFYRMARRSGTECAAIFDACCVLKLADEQRLSEGRELLVRVVAMLTAMVLRLKKQKSGSGSGKRTGKAGSEGR